MLRTCISNSSHIDCCFKSLRNLKSLNVVYVWHIACIYLVYVMHIPGFFCCEVLKEPLGIYMVYTWYIPTIYLVGVPDDASESIVDNVNAPESSRSVYDFTFLALGADIDPPSAKWGVHILHIESVVYIFFISWILFCIFFKLLTVTINCHIIKTCILLAYSAYVLHILHINFNCIGTFQLFSIFLHFPFSHFWV
jgi:hypothetical protein